MEDQSRTEARGDIKAVVNTALEMRRIYTPDEAMRLAFRRQADENDAGDRFQSRAVIVQFQVHMVQGTIQVKSGDKVNSWTLGRGSEDVGLCPRHEVDDARDQFSVILTARAKKQLDRLGIHDFGKHFMRQDHSRDQPEFGRLLYERRDDRKILRIDR